MSKMATIIKTKMYAEMLTKELVALARKKEDAIEKLGERGRRGDKTEAARMQAHLNAINQELALRVRMHGLWV